MLWDASAINGYAIEASDGRLGTVSELLFEDVGWVVRWLVVDTGNWLPGRKVLLPLSALGQPDRALRHFPIKLTMQQVKDSPDVDTDLPVSRQIEAQVHDYFGWDPYWSGSFPAMSNTLRDIARHDCVQLNKPVRLKELTQAVQCLLPASRSAGHSPPVQHLSTEGANNLGQVIFVIDDDRHIREELRKALEADGRAVEDFATCEAFLDAYHPGREACLLVDAYLPGMSGLELLQHLSHLSHRLPAIMITGHGDVPMAVQAMKAGALDFIEKPFNESDLRASVERALEQSRDLDKSLAWRETAANRIAVLTPRQRQIMDLVLAGHPSKNIAADLGISQRTVETHRASIMKKTGAKSLPALARLAVAAAEKGADKPLVQDDPSITVARRTVRT